MYFSIRSLNLIIIIGFALAAAQAQVAAQDDLQKPAEITGRVTINGRGASEVVVSLRPSSWVETISSMMGTHQIKPTKTDKSGYFRFANVRDVFRATLYVHDLEGKFAFSNRRGLLEHGIPLTVSPGANITEVDFALTRGAVITGRVLDERGRGVAGEYVTCQWFDPDESIWRERGTPVQTQSHGHFCFSGLPAGNYRLVSRYAETNRYATTYYPNATDETKAYTLEIKAGADVANIDLRLSPRRPF